jgi:hypothetical protein
MKVRSILFSVLLFGMSPVIGGEILFDDTFGQTLPRMPE